MIRRNLASLIAVSLCLAFAGCKPSSSAPPAANTNAVTPPVSVTGQTTRNSEPGTPSWEQLPPDRSTFHWLGKKRILADTNSASLARVWQLAEATALENQTLDKLALAPWRKPNDDSATNGAPIALLRPLLDDLLQEESRLEIFHPTNQPAEFSLAIKLSTDRARLWQTNLATVLESLTGSKAALAAEGWTLPDKTNRTYTFARTNDWTVLKLTSENSKLGTRNSELGTQPWLSANLDLAAFLGRETKGALTWPRLRARITGDGQNVITKGELQFPKPLNLDLQPWQVPTNLIHDPLLSFTALRGIHSVPTWAEFWRGIRDAEPPNQLFQWAQDGGPFQTYFAVPVQDAVGLQKLISSRLLGKGNGWLAQNSIGSFQASTNNDRVTWTGVPFMLPTAKAIETETPQFLWAGLFPETSKQLTMPDDLLNALRTRANFVYYDWEVTGPRVDTLNGILQVLRVTFHKARLSQQSLGSVWLQKAKSDLGNCTTGAMVGNATSIAFQRTSTMGLSALELHLLMDWLESPAFPNGSSTLLNKPDITLPYPARPVPQSQ